jgi:hypothetical protein
MDTDEDQAKGLFSEPERASLIGKLVCMAEILFLSVIQSCNFAHGRQRFGLRWQSAAATPLSVLPVVSKSGVALRFPPQSKICGCGASRVRFICVHPWLKDFSTAWTRLRF